MKKKEKWITLIIAIIIIAVVLYFLIPKLTGKAATSFDCIDSEGKDYYVKGTTENGPNKGTDYCYNEKQLKEYYCKDENSMTIEVYSCSDGCEEGACKIIPKEIAELSQEKGISSGLIVAVIIIILIIIGFLIYKRRK